jgi:predicted alpha/beta-hydrolase family hydrolase
LIDPTPMRVRLEGGAATTALLYPAADPVVGATFILAHGAGAGQQSRFIVDSGRALSAMGLDVVTFNFLFTEQRRRIPDRAPVLEGCYRSVIDLVRADVPSARSTLVIGGKSMGGRMATHVAAADRDSALAGLVLLGYPLHPPGKPHQRRDAHLSAIGRPMLFVQGSRDGFGTPDELAPIVASLHPAPVLHVVSNGDHSFAVPRRNPVGQAAVFADVQEAIVNWIRGLALTA